MISNKTQMNPMTQKWISESFGMSTCGHALGSTTPTSDVLGTSAFVATARERQIVATGVFTKGHMGVAIRDLAYVPGTNAWSPPLC